jgi:hypothetical protein
MALLEELEGDYAGAFDRIVEAEKLFSALQSPYAAQARTVRERLEQKMWR